jgi:hypothetical protein
MFALTCDKEHVTRMKNRNGYIPVLGAQTLIEPSSPPVKTNFPSVVKLPQVIPPS